MENDKWHMMERIKLPNQEKIRTLGEKKTHKYLGISETGHRQKSGHERKENKKSTRNQTIEQEPYKRDK